MARRWDEYDSMFDHSDTSWSNLAGDNKESDIKPNDEVINNWNKKTEEVISLVEKGVTGTDEWCITNSNWVEFKTGGFTGRSFSVSSIVTEERVVKYLSNHKVKLTKSEMIKLMREVSNLNATDSKTVLKKYILKRKEKAIPLNLENVDPPNEAVRRTPEKSLTSGVTLKKNSILSVVINYIFGG